MDGVALRAALAGSRFADVRVVESIDSTNRALLAWAIAGHDEVGVPVSDGAVLIARTQTAGRGRLGRSWIAPADSALLMTALIDSSTIPVERWPLLSFAMGLAVVEEVGKLGADVALKWPNDVVVMDDKAPSGYRKLAGILAESHLSDRCRFVVVGVGVNLIRPGELDPTLGPEAVPTWLDDHVDLVAPDAITAGIVRAFDRAVSTLTVDASGFLGRYRSVCSTLGRAVEADLGPRRVIGTAVDVDSAGHLIVEATSGERLVLSAGDVVHLRPAR